MKHDFYDVSDLSTENKTNFNICHLIFSDIILNNLQQKCHWSSPAFSSWWEAVDSIGVWGAGVKGS